QFGLAHRLSVRLDVKRSRPRQLDVHRLSLPVLAVDGQYAFANTTRPSDGRPVTMHLPPSFLRSNGMQRVVAFVSPPTLSSVWRVPSQWARKKPPGSSIFFLNSS